MDEQKKGLFVVFEGIDGTGKTTLIKMLKAILEKEKYSIDDEILRPYFKLENVVEGVFQVANKLYGLNFID